MSVPFSIPLGTAAAYAGQADAQVFELIVGHKIQNL